MVGGDGVYDLVVIGAGAAGMAAAIWAHRLDLAVLLVDGSPGPGGQLLRVNGPIIDYPGLLTANGREMAAHFAEHLNTLAVPCRFGDPVIRVDLASAGTQQVHLTDGTVLQSRYLALATGVRPRRLKVPGEAEMIRRGEVYAGSRDAALFAGRPVVVVGGGDRALENALLLAAAGAAVTLVHRTDRFRGRETFVQEVLADPRIHVILSQQVARILSESDRVSGVELQDGRVVPAAAVFVYIGMRPNVDLIADQIAIDITGLVKVDPFGRTSHPGVFALGDICTPPLYSSLSTAVGQGMIIAKTLAAAE